jgi:hypothetical protein
MSLKIGEIFEGKDKHFYFDLTLQIDIKDELQYLNGETNMNRKYRDMDLELEDFRGYSNTISISMPDLGDEDTTQISLSKRHRIDELSLKNDIDRLLEKYKEIAKDLELIRDFDYIEKVYSKLLSEASSNSFITSFDNVFSYKIQDLE